MMTFLCPRLPSNHQCATYGKRLSYMFIDMINLLNFVSRSGLPINICFFVFYLNKQHAHALELLSDKLAEGASALDVGSGSGYLTACFARMVSM